MAKPQALEATDLSLLRMEQARMLKERVRSSCLIVEFIVAYTSVVMALTNSVQIALIWFVSRRGSRTREL